MFRKFKQKQLIEAGVALCQISHEARAKGVEPVVPPELAAKIAWLSRPMPKRSFKKIASKNGVGVVARLVPNEVELIIEEYEQDLAAGTTN